VKISKPALLLALPLLLIISFIGGYSYWNHAEPEKTCSQCHEIRNSVESFGLSAHRELSCTDCHGTALSNGLHSMKEKANMVFTHFSSQTYHHDIQMNEKQILETSEKCVSCHQSEYKKWLAGGHSSTYEDIFLDSVHNAMEPPYPDCFRCHGMFYDGTIADLMEPLDITGPWRLKDKDKADVATIPCLSCHQTHSENLPLSADLIDSLGYMPRNPIASLYIRADKIHLRSDHLLIPNIHKDGKEIKVSPDPVQRLCIQCHSPNYKHMAGTEDDRTPTGVHEGISCRACHETHSNDTRKACDQCHPAITNCNLDVKTMNTTYMDINSPNNIHFVACNDCHENI
jgi:hypothetical protein